MKTATKRAVHNLHVPLSKDLYDALRGSARSLGQPATRVARAAIAAWVKARARDTLRTRLAAYGAAVAGSPDDLDEALEAAGAAHLLDETNPE